MESKGKVYFPYHKVCDMESIGKVYFPHHKVCDMESIGKVYVWMNANVILYHAVQWSCWPELLAECGLLRLVLQGDHRLLPDV
jgi:hypothetical protein